MVNSVEENKAKVFFQGRGSGVTIATKALKRVCHFSFIVSVYTVVLVIQVEGQDVFPDDVVRVIDDMEVVHRLAGRGWSDDMALVSSLT